MCGQARSASVLGDLPQKIQPRGGGWEMLVAGADLDIVALGETTCRSGLHARFGSFWIKEFVAARQLRLFACMHK